MLTGTEYRQSTHQENGLSATHVSSQVVSLWSLNTVPHESVCMCGCLHACLVQEISSCVEELQPLSGPLQNGNKCAFIWHCCNVDLRHFIFLVSGQSNIHFLPLNFAEEIGKKVKFKGLLTMPILATGAFSYMQVKVHVAAYPSVCLYMLAVKQCVLTVQALL